ncbi:MAG: hypothetical protein FD149_589 [Rhodospirillaceae bacterium]|nr:MAG: hypothetical protein FD149_589 [Rhodospirillaceae bacterium]
MRLTDDEAGGIAASRGVTLTPEQATALNARADGWVAGVRLMLENTSPTYSKGLPPKDRSALFAYFATEVFTRLTPAGQHILHHAALFPSTMTAAMVGALAGAEGAEAVLVRLARMGWFTSVYEKEEQEWGSVGEVQPSPHPHATVRFYQFHALFREFLRAQGHFEAPVRRAAAHLLQDAGLEGDAAFLLIEAGAWEDLGALVRDQAPRMLGLGRHRTLEHWLRALPPERVNSDPWLLYWL